MKKMESGKMQAWGLVAACAIGVAIFIFVTTSMGKPVSPPEAEHLDMSQVYECECGWRGVADDMHAALSEGSEPLVSLNCPVCGAHLGWCTYDEFQ